MSCYRVARLAIPIALAALFGLPAASSLARPTPAGPLPLAVCHQYCHGANQQLASANQDRPENTRTIAITTASAFDRKDAAIGATLGSGATLIAVAVLTRGRRARSNRPAKNQA
jgi:hypothetical protein